MTADRIERLDVVDMFLGTELQFDGQLREASTAGACDERHVLG